MSGQIILIVEIWLGVMFAAILTVFIWKAKDAGKTNVVVLKANHTYAATKLKTKGDQLKVNKNWSINFKPLDFFEEIKPAFIFWRNPKRLVFALENTPKALSWDLDENDNLKADSLVKKFGWTPEEALDYLKKMAKKAAVENRPMSQSMFYILVILGVVNILFMFLMMNRLGGF